MFACQPRRFRRCGKNDSNFIFYVLTNHLFCNHNDIVTRKERLMKKQTCLYSQIGLLSHILHPVGRSLADGSPLFISLSVYNHIMPLGTEGFPKTMGTEKSHF